MLQLVEGLKKRETACLVVIAVATTYFAQYAVPCDVRLYYTMSVSPLLIGLLSFVLFKKGLECIKDSLRRGKLELVLTTVLALLFSGFVIEGAQLADDPSFFNPIDSSLLLAIVFCALPIIAILFLVWRNFSFENMKPCSGSASCKWVLTVFTVILLCWLPWYLGMFPGLFCYNMGESNGEWGQYVSGDLTTHFPVFHTLLTGTLVDLGRNVFGDGVEINPGVAFLTTLQCLVIAAIFTYCVYWIRQRGAKRAIVYAAIAYFALNPVTSIFVMCTTRDTLFSAFALLVAISSYDTLDKSMMGGGRIKALVCLVVSCTLLCLLRNNGLYSFIVFAVVLILLSWQKKMLAVICTVVLAFSLLWTGPIYETMGVQKEENQHKEALALPIQQLAYVSSSGKLTEDETALLQGNGYTIPSEEDYFPKISDPSKYTIFNMNIGALVGVYFSIGVSHPIDYLYAELARTQDLWSPYSYVNCYNGFIDQVAGKETSFFSTTINSPGSPQPLIPDILKLAHRLGGELFLQNIPLVSLLVSLPFYLILMLIVLFRAVMVKNRKAIGAMSIFAILALGSYFGPCVLPRYYMYLFFGLPLMVFLLFGLCGKNVKEDS